MIHVAQDQPRKNQKSKDPANGSQNYGQSVVIGLHSRGCIRSTCKKYSITSVGATGGEEEMTLILPPA